MSSHVKPLRVVQILPELNEGGVERGTVEMNRELVRRDVDSVVICNGGKLVQQITADGGRHFNLDVCSKNPLTMPLRIHALRNVLTEVMPDILHARSRVPAWLCRFANSKLRIPFITTVHGLNKPNLFSAVMASGDHVICVGEPVRRHIASHYAPDSAKVTVIPRGVDLEAFDPANVSRKEILKLREKLGITDNRVIGSVGRITQVKDFETVIAAAASLAKKKPDVRCVIFGGTHEKKRTYAERLTAFAEDTFPGGVIFAGSMSDMPLAYSCCDVVVNASPGMGNVARTILEALALDVPVLSTKLEGLEELVQDQVNGFVFRTGDVEDLADKIHLVLQNPPHNVRATIPAEFTLDSMIESTLAIYRSIVG